MQLLVLTVMSDGLVNGWGGGKDPEENYERIARPGTGEIIPMDAEVAKEWGQKEGCKQEATQSPREVFLCKH